MRSRAEAGDAAAVLCRLDEIARSQEILLADLASGRPGDLEGVARATAEAVKLSRAAAGGDALRSALARIHRLNAAVAEAVLREKRLVAERIGSAARARRIGADLRPSPAPGHDRTA